MRKKNHEKANSKLQKVKLNAPNGHASYWKTQSGDIELSQVHLETLIFMLRKSNSKDHCKRWTRGSTRAGILACHGVRHLRSPEKSTSADGVQGNVTDCQGGHRLKDARCLGVRADPATCREAKIRISRLRANEGNRLQAQTTEGMRTRRGATADRKKAEYIFHGNLRSVASPGGGGGVDRR